jgi:fructose-specific phosphotransferase system IIC component
MNASDIFAAVCGAFIGGLLTGFVAGYFAFKGDNK